jgi:NarL family two-component system response regulator LiaR
LNRPCAKIFFDLLKYWPVSFYALGGAIRIDKAIHVQPFRLFGGGKLQLGNDHIRVLIADDHALMSEGIRLVLDRDGLVVVGVARTGREAVNLANELEPDVVLLDIRMPDMDGIQALAAIKTSRPQTGVIMLTSYANPDYVARALSLGAAGYLTKEYGPKRLANAVRAVAAGEAIINPDVLKETMSTLCGVIRMKPVGPFAKRAELTPQELRVLTLIAEGLDNSTIAETLSVSTNTVKSHVRKVFLKLGVEDRTKAAIWAFRNGLVN